MNENVVIETERLILRKYTLDDFDALYEIVSDETELNALADIFAELRFKISTGRCFRKSDTIFIRNTGEEGSEKKLHAPAVTGFLEIPLITRSIHI